MVNGQMTNCQHTRTYLEGHQLCIYAEGMEAGGEIEQERIIKLLEKYEAGGSDPDTYDYIPHEQLIALIKGEQR
jgi:hypothetical protein